MWQNKPLLPKLHTSDNCYISELSSTCSSHKVLRLRELQSSTGWNHGPWYKDWWCPGNHVVPGSVYGECRRQPPQDVRRRNTRCSTLSVRTLQRTDGSPANPKIVDILEYMRMPKRQNISRRTLCWKKIALRAWNMVLSGTGKAGRITCSIWPPIRNSGRLCIIGALGM